MKVQQWLVAALVALLIVGCGSPSGETTGSSTTTASNPTSGSSSQATAQPNTSTNDSGSTVARVGEVVLSRQDLDQRVARIQEALKAEQATNPGAQPQPNDVIERDLVELFIQQNLLLSIARDRKIELTDKEIDEQIGQIRTNVGNSGGGQTLDQVVQGRLGFAGENTSEFRQFVSSLIAQDKLANTLVPSDTVQKEVTDQVMADAKKEVQQADVAHILVETEDEAKKAIERLDKGEEFAALAKELSKDPGSAENGGEYKGVQPGQFVPEFDKAMFEDLQPGETTKTPVKTQFGYHVIRLIERRTGPQYTDEQAKQMIEQQVAQRLQQERGEALQKLLDEERKKAKDSGQLVEPVYPTPTPLPPPPADQGLPTEQPAAPTAAP
ncbi:MAG: hypothetical protein OHK0022_16200 [Roseiflexaceae bacterium]